MVLFGMTFEAWHLFASAGIVLAILEVFAPGFILLPIGVAALLSAVFAGFVPDLTAQFAFFGTMDLVMFFAVRPIFLKKEKDALKTNVDSMVGAEAFVTKEIESDQRSGYVKLYGDEWEALSANGHKIEMDARIRIVRVEGNKVFVELAD